MTQIKEIKDNKSEICNAVLRQLPEWFGIESAIVKYVEEVKAMPMLIAETATEKNVGFISLHFHNDFNAEIHVMGVLPKFHGKGVGTALIKAAEDLARAQNTKFMTVKTLSSSRLNQEYDQTRRFYQSVGFLPLEEFRTLWGEANPCLLMIKLL